MLEGTMAAKKLEMSLLNQNSDRKDHACWEKRRIKLTGLPAPTGGGRGLTGLS